MIPRLVSVIMSNYNTPIAFLKDAIDSILEQTYEQIELLIIDDCSEDESVAYIEHIQDARIKLLRNETNMGITKSLNRGLDAADGEFIARMDADDISEPERIEKQVNYLKMHPEVIVCGTGVRLIGDGAASIRQKEVFKEIPEKEAFRVRLLFGNQTNIIHPSAMFRRSALDQYGIRYNERYRYAQDYRMWVECSQYGECINIPEILFNYRIHGKAVSLDKKEAQKKCAMDIIGEQLSWLHLELPACWEDIHYGYLTERREYDLNCIKWMKQIISQNRIYHVFDEKYLSAIIWRRWAEISYSAITRAHGLGRVKIMLKIPARCLPDLMVIRKQKRHSKTVTPNED